LLAVACGGGGDAVADAGPPADARGPNDARLAPCGIPDPGIRCRDAHTIERCSGTLVTTETCASAESCSPDPAGTGGAVCVGATATCDRITDNGTCSGPILAFCDTDQTTLIIYDCSQVFATCGAPGTTIADCTTPCTVAGIPDRGRCDGN